MMHSISTVAEIIALLSCISSCAYYLFYLAASQTLRRSWDTAQNAPSDEMPPVSILKPLKGTDPEMYESLRNHYLQDYSHYQIVFGVSDPSDSAADCVDA